MTVAMHNELEEHYKYFYAKHEYYIMIF